MTSDDVTNPQTRTVTFQDIVRALRRGASLAVMTAVVAGVVAFVVTQRMEPVYQASATVLASQPPATFGNVDLIRPPNVDVRVYQRVLQDGAVVHDALFRLDGVDRDEAAMKAIQRRVRVTVESQDVSSVIHIAVRDSSPERAAVYANVLATALIDWDRNRTREMVANSIGALERSITGLDDDIAAAVLAGDATEAQRLQALGATLREQRVRELESARARSASAVVVGLLETLSVAKVPTEAIGPRLVFNVFVAVVLGLTFGYAAQFVGWSLTNAISDRSQLGSLVGLPVLASFPRPRRGSHRLLANEVSYFSAKLRLAVRERRPAVIGITSVSTYEEKVGVAVSLADSLSRSGLRTLLIDADLRQLGPGFGIDLTNAPVPSLETYLQESTRPVQPMKVLGDNGLAFDLVPAQHAVRQPSELIAYGLGAMLASLHEVYDAIVVDLPPILSFADALAAAPACTGLVLAVGRGSNGKRVRDAVDLFESNEIPVFGTVLTGDGGVRRTSRPSGTRLTLYGNSANPPVSVVDRASSRAKAHVRHR